MILCSSSAHLITSVFSVMLKLNMDPGYILLNIDLILIGEISSKTFAVGVLFII